MAEAVLTCTHNLCFEQKQEKYQTFSSKDLQFLQLRKNLYITWACFRNVMFILRNSGFCPVPVHRFHDEVLSFRMPDSYKTFESDGNLVLVIVSLMLL